MEYLIRPAELCEAGIIAGQRAAMFRDMGAVTPGSQSSQARFGAAADEYKLDWCASHEIDHVTLPASGEGGPLYESQGFRSTNEMKLSKSGE